MASKDEWLYFIEEEDGEMFALELVEDIILNSKKVLFEKQIDIQILPYTVNFAEQVLSDMINFYYFQRDPGNIDATLLIPDEEPECVRIDSWAPAAVPIRKQIKHVKPQAFQPTKEEVANEKEETASIPPPKKEKKIKEETQTVKKPQSLAVPTIKKPKAVNPSTKIQDLSFKKKLPSTLSKQGKADSSIIGIESEKSIAEENKKFLSKLANAAENNKIDYTYDQNGRIIPLNSTTSWNPVQEVKYKITGSFNPNSEDPISSSGISSGFKKGNKIPKISSAPATQKKTSKPKQVIETEPRKETDSTNFSGFQDDPKLGIPSLAETMKIVPGVTLREGDIVKTAPEHHTTIRSTLTTAGKDISLERGVFQTSQIKLLEEIIANSKVTTPNAI